MSLDFKIWSDRHNSVGCEWEFQAQKEAEKVSDRTMAEFLRIDRISPLSNHSICFVYSA